jgi:hypothetical protein
MTYVKQPPLSVTIPIKVYRDRNGVIGVFYSQGNGPLYVWRSQQAPSGTVIWDAAQPLDKTTDELTEILYDQVPETLYEALKTFYIGKPKPVYRQTEGTALRTSR